MANRRLRALLDRVIQHQRPSSYTVDGGGGRTPVPATVNANEKAAIWPMSSVPELATAFDRRDIVVSHVVCCENDLAVKADDRITDDSESGVYYLVKDAMKFQNDKVMRNTTVYVIAADRRTV